MDIRAPDSRSEIMNHALCSNTHVPCGRMAVEPIVREVGVSATADHRAQLPIPLDGLLLWSPRRTRDPPIQVTTETICLRQRARTQAAKRVTDTPQVDSVRLGVHHRFCHVSWWSFRWKNLLGCSPKPWSAPVRITGAATTITSLAHFIGSDCPMEASI
jgi:hypothetical protein